ncbi:thioesterase II family protein [Paractinoplanes hotanensis]|uniref:Alpha/beta fold hydrolase n=1 Tax=Paractinoplanes hotanensis TaxID=2906497 RepID=A0ABT0YBI1_9ACTN|nr:alpha/beta fold hydrolase [Actinoplanes hotanensis]MCM4083105.1 alpha/beta fold hydrolase [Actinoplanes hotanensis]
MDRWVSHPAPRPEAPIKLFCFPYAGGGASAFRQWAPRLAGAEVAAVQLPGRENRLGERPIDAMDRLVDALRNGLAAHLDDRPFAFFGHSMGARIAFALTKRLQGAGDRLPVRLFASASPAPWLQVPETAWRQSDDELLAWLTGLGGTPPEVLASPDLMRLMLPTIRADLTVGATWTYRLDQPLPIGIRAFAGTADEYATPERARAWARETAAGCDVTVLDGGHFFVHEKVGEVLDIVDSDLCAVLDGAHR